MSMLRTLLALMAIAVAAAAPASAQPEICDIEAAMQWCDTAPLDRIEGIWEYPEDGVAVLIRKSAIAYGRYDVVALSAAGGAALPGEIIGKVVQTPLPEKFSMQLYTRRGRRQELCGMRRCELSLVANDYGLSFESVQPKWRLNPIALLPKFWRLGSLVRREAGKKPTIGMRKTYPSYDGNGSSRFSVRYL